ncbi:cytoskeleton protein RodZ [Marinobacter sp. JH2]|nr:RodZ domain-containing protein [Marinobacter sp. JH2]QBM16784.1 cytoskeleton protein RodZ [Marinobacter sp. JH2]
MVSEKPENYTPAEPVGQQLKRAREAKSLSVSAVAEQQHLRPSVVQAIEAGDYEKIDTELFLKGYVRAYARQVGLNADSVIRDLDVELAPARKRREEALQANPLVDIERRKKRKQRIAKTILWLLLIGVVASIALYFVAQKQTANDDRNAPVPETVTESRGDVAEELPEPGIDSPSSAPLVEPAVTDTSEGEEPLREADAPLAMPQSNLDESEVPAVATESIDRPVASDAPLQTPDANESSAESAIGRLEMTFSSDCWLKVTDATGQRLASGLRRQGDKLDVRGTPPLSVVVGAMSAVEVIRFQDETVDMGDFRVVNNRSEFTLEP